jgi:predicted dehydrogenase
MTQRRIGLVGCGRWGLYILRDLCQLGCEVVVVDPSSSARARALAAGAADGIAAIADLPSVAAMVVATPTRTHAAVIDALLPRALPIFAEKPLTADRDSASRLAADGARVFVLDKWRYHPGIEALRDIARSGELGPVIGLRTIRHGCDHAHSDVDPTWILAPHDLSIGIEILGDLPTPRAAVAECVGGNPTGIIGILGTAPWMVLDVSAQQTPRRRAAQLQCREGMATLSDAYADHVDIVRRAPPGGPVAPPESRAIATEMPLLRELRACLEYLDGGAAPRSNAVAGARIVHALAELRALAGLETSSDSVPPG